MQKPVKPNLKVQVTFHTKSNQTRTAKEM